jgi:hypothetical protein
MPALRQASSRVARGFPTVTTPNRKLPVPVSIRRPRPVMDRVWSAWLIRRIIDPLVRPRAAHLVLPSGSSNLDGRGQERQRHLEPVLVRISSWTTSACIRSPATTRRDDGSHFSRNARALRVVIRSEDDFREEAVAQLYLIPLARGEAFPVIRAMRDRLHPTAAFSSSTGANRLVGDRAYPAISQCRFTLIQYHVQREIFRVPLRVMSCGKPSSIREE